MSDILSKAMSMAIEEARQYMGAASPNPPVGATAIDSLGNIITSAAHQKFGGTHAETKLLEKLSGQPVDTIAVTLEPCCHHGKTPPCTKALIASGVKTVAIGTSDPNPKVSGKGIKELQEKGIKVISGVMENECLQLIAPFKKWVEQKMPWVIMKRAFDPTGSMIPPPGKTTFTSTNALTYAHRIRKSCDAIITGSNTILTDNPQFTVRHVPDHPNKKRWLVIMDRRNRVPETWMGEACERGFHCIRGYDITDILNFLGENGVLRVLVEAGPTLSESILRNRYVDEEIRIEQYTTEEKIKHVYRDY